ncbi:hypothetical protein [uncultured Fusobacterium sp.]|uniref:hypothetical protein n=1 Tax=uncultured Fusobacterium sp. TaxID=159267 RepID=UPI0025CCA120|nr:hypothetical protein [uncultured Fusobacterium sp.]
MQVLEDLELLAKEEEFLQNKEELKEMGHFQGKHQKKKEGEKNGQLKIKESIWIRNPNRL